MDTGALKKFAQAARNHLMEQVRGKLGLVLAEGSAARREAPQAVKDLESTIAANGREQVVEQVAYTWFNRFTALRFMDVNGYNSIRVVSPAEGQTRPELLAEVLAGNVSDDVSAAVKAKVLALLDGRSPSSDPQGEAYRLLLVTTCNQWHEHMPFMFERISDFTELLMPDDLLSQNSILAHTRNAMTDETCQDVEVIGWLYQFYISEKKDQVFAGLKKNQKITAANIPAATQLFTPHWIVRYLVENSLGRLWLLNRPSSKLAERMDYYIAPEEPETNFLRVNSPKDIKICDPACGSAHMLTYAFDLLYAIYEEEGFDPVEIPALILEHNLTGIEIDDRAGALAAFALVMKAAAKLGRRRFLRMDLIPNIVVLKNVTFTPAEMQDVVSVVVKDLFTEELRETLQQFEQAKNFGSLIVPKLRDATETLRVVMAHDFDSDLLLKEVQERIVVVLRMAEALSTTYHAVVANPPYMGGKGMNGDLQKLAKRHYPDSKSDLYSMFIDRGMKLTRSGGFIGIIAMHGWLFLSSFDSIRSKVLKSTRISSLLQIGFNSFPELNSKVTLGAAFVLHNGASSGRGLYFNLNDAPQTADKGRVFLEKKGANDRYSIHADRFAKIPGSPIAFWLGEEIIALYDDARMFGDVVDSKQGLATADNDRFMRRWYEVEIKKVGFGLSSSADAKASGLRWFPINKGGDFRKWYGNHEMLVNWENDGAEIRSYVDQRYPYLNGNIDYVIKDRGKFFCESVSWSDVTFKNSFRYYPKGFLYDATGHSAFWNGDHDKWSMLSFCNNKIASKISTAINPTMHFHIGYFDSLPWPEKLDHSAAEAIATDAISVSALDWNSFETSWDFAHLPLLSRDSQAGSLEAAYSELRSRWRVFTQKLQRLEEENNRIFIDAYGLQDHLTVDVPIEEITLTCNPAYRYGIKVPEDEREARLLEDTVAEFLHYAVGCMFGRYSLDAPGLILANQGERLEDYLARVPSPAFMPDKDNVIPVLDGEWFADDVTERFRKFLRVTFGEETYRENLAFVEKALGKDIRKWFTRDFFDYHVRRFKKRPIYWLFSSPKGTFQALMYMHRYRPETVSVLLNDYLREHIRKLEGHRAALDRQADDPATPPAKATRARKDIITVSQQIDELKDWERDVIFPLAQQRIEIDLDDGVKTNYPKFGAALRAIKGLEATDE